MSGGPFAKVEDIKASGAQTQLREALRRHLWHIRELADKAKVDDYRAFKECMDEAQRRIDDARLIYDATVWPHRAVKPEESDPS